MYYRFIQKDIEKLLFKGKIILIYGPRQAGKTTLAKEILRAYGNDGIFFNCEVDSVKREIGVPEPTKLKSFFGDKKVVVLDEAQSIENIGRILKTFVDTYPNQQIIATGSSSFDLANKIKEPLTGRSIEFLLYPLSLSEITESSGKITREDIDELMRTGSYPAVVAERSREIKEDILKNLATN